MKNLTKVDVLFTIFIYIWYFSLFFYAYKFQVLENYALYLCLWLVLLFIKDILKYFIDKFSFKTTKNNLSKLFFDFTNSKINNIYLFLYLNRNYLFPFILIVYMIFLLVKQTHIFGLDKYKLFLFNENILLGVTIFSGILTIFKDDKDKNYILEVKKNSYLYILLTILLSLLWTYIILEQTIKLWNLSYIISIISWILIFLVWISILEDDEESNI